ncbi:TonB-dependent receptor [Candidatus Marinimicrobia bacterium]|nr:TonB-dependent receptor [bacterium]MDA7641915.1 TonB-dependent receptor [Candidatus Neomarinimicrobiota bacterium]MDA9841472.1 TonB-dependent receptor [Candidatus Neomarinimicrobiota bacterium]MDB3887541.1 TonB-dependent receptor [Candidatus Neomarinimicrobiota bacterium]
MKYYILLSTILISNLFSQTLNGIVVDSSGEPLSHVIIRELDSENQNDNWTTSDNNGSFIIEISHDSKIELKRFGFENQEIQLDGNESQVFTLSNKNVNMKAVNVYGKNNSRYLKNKSLNNNLGSFSKNGSLSQLPSLELRTYGGYAGVTSASFDAGFARHTKVLFNGVDLTDAQNGQVDLSSFPSFALRSLNYRLNSGTTYGSGSIDGTLNINTKNSPNRVFYSSGDYGFNQYGATYTMGRENSKRTITIGKTSYDGDYKFKDSVTGSSKKRENNSLDQFFFAMNREFLVRDDLIININSLTTKNTRGAAGSTSFPSILATRTDEYELYSLSFMKFFIDSNLKIYINRSTNNQVYDDPNESFPVFSEHDLDQSSFGLDFEKEINTNLDYQLSVKQQVDSISSTDLSNQELNSSSASFLLNYTNNEKDFKISPSTRFDKQSDNDKLTYNLSFESVDQFLKDDLSYFDFRLDAGSSFQFPTLNDLYWPDGLYSAGNPDLKPEESDYFSVNMTNNSVLGKFTVTATMKDYENLILWQPNESLKYIPINVSSASRTTYNINFLKEFASSQLQISYNIYDSKDNDMDEKLLYVPDYSANIFLSHNFNQSINVALNYKYTGKRILQYGSDWSDQTDGDAYGVLDFSVSKDFDALKTSLIVDNLLDETFESTLGYPEPGRSIKLVTEYKI